LGVKDAMSRSDGLPQAVDGAVSGFAQHRRELGEGVLDWIEVGAVRRQVEQLGPGGLDQIAHCRSPVENFGLA
jgi:hypothetical protein